MSESALDNKLNQLDDLVAKLPEEGDRKKALAILAEARATISRRKRILTLVQEALSQLRLDMKYLVFDLEATRRERDAAVSRLRED